MDEPTPVSIAIRLPNQQRLRAAAERVLSAIDLVHLVAGLPTIPLDTRRSHPDDRGHYRIKRNSGRAVGIGIDPEDPNPEFCLLHEIGHFIDHQALGRPRAWASPTHLDLTNWRTTVEGTVPVRRLRNLARLSDVEFARAIGSRNITQQREGVRYMLLYTETWARSYAQYVARQTGELILLNQLADERETGDPLWDLSQWTDGEFEPIATAIDRLFHLKGWLR